MGVYIKGMKMPTQCEDCFCYRHNAEYDYAYCNISSVNVRGHGNARLNKCPLVPIPQHGRLIDADALREDWLENGENEYVYDTNAFLDSLDTAPTIIEAEEDE